MYRDGSQEELHGNPKIHKSKEKRQNPVFPPLILFTKNRGEAGSSYPNTLVLGLRDEGLDSSSLAEVQHRPLSKHSFLECFV
jgi:hypothetical protein